jgi:hypothetical protein
MKVALLLSGLPRAVKSGYDRSWSHIINNYDTDVYLHAWKDDSYGCNWKDVADVYNIENVKSFHIQEPFKFTKYKEGISLPHEDKSRPLPEYDVMSCFRQFPMFYSWQKVYRQMYDTNIEYDCVIRSRYDMNFYHEFRLENLNLNVLNHGPGGRYYDDNLCITDKTNSDKLFLNIFNDLLLESRRTGVLNSAEESWSMLIDKSKLPTCVVHELHFTLLRENLLWFL